MSYVPFEPWRCTALVLAGLCWLSDPAMGQSREEHADPAIGQRLGTVASLAITTNGARSDNVSGEETARVCARFQLRMWDVREFFAVARTVDSRAYHHDLEMSRCHATGHVRFDDGRSGHWWIDKERRGLVLLQGGRIIFLYCPRCAARSFEPVYDPDR